MDKAEKILFALLLLPLLGATCSRNEMELELLRETLIYVERQTRVDVIILTPNLCKESRLVASKLRQTMESTAVVPSDGNELPEHYLVLRDISVADNNANVSVTLGPIPQAKPGFVLLACGTTYTFSFHKSSDGRWQQGDLQTLDC